jgi:hypothetical protein
VENKKVKYEYLCDPCRNFCILGAITIRDPKDDREKVVLSSFFSGGTGGLVFIDPETQLGEWIELPGDEGAWALLSLDDKKLLVGTCGLKGYLHCLDLTSRTWAEPLRNENETYIWNLVQGSDGMVYGGTWPGCVLLQYDPEKHVLKNMGKMSRHSGNMYSRTVWSVRNYIFINCGMEKPHITIWSIDTGNVKPFGKKGAQIIEIDSNYICTKTNGKLDFYDIKTFEHIENNLDIQKDEINQNRNNKTYQKILFDKGIGKILKLKDDRIFGIRGQEYFIVDTGSDDSFTYGNGAALSLRKIPVDAPATGILTITSDNDECIWGSSNFGQTIFCYNTKSGEYFNTPAVCNNGGEVYGIRCINNKIFMTCYAGGDHVVYDPKKPWDQINNVNPKTLRSVAPELIRPGAKSIIGPDGALWTGWTAKYGVYGGGISRVDPDTYNVTEWKNLVPGQSIRSIASGGKNLYFTTSGTGNGLPEKVEPLFLGMMNTEGKLIWKKEYIKGQKLGLVETVGKFGILNVDNEIEIFDCNNMEFINSIKMKAPCSCIIKYSEDKAALFCDKKLYFLKPAEGRLEYIADLPGDVGTAVIDPKGHLYFAYKSGLYRIIFVL